jgi:phosphonate transport system substrate-binding protein
MPTDYLGVVEALRNKTADLAFIHPAGYVFASREAKAQIVAVDVWHGKTSYTSRIFVRKDSGFKNLEQLRGKTIAFVDPGSTSGYVYPMVMLMKRLVKERDPKTFFKEAMFAGTHEAALLALLNGKWTQASTRRRSSIWKDKEQ